MQVVGSLNREERESAKGDRLLSLGTPKTKVLLGKMLEVWAKNLCVCGMFLAVTVAGFTISDG